MRGRGRANSRTHSCSTASQAGPQRHTGHPGRGPLPPGISGGSVLPGWLQGGRPARRARPQGSPYFAGICLSCLSACRPCVGVSGVHQPVNGTAPAPSVSTQSLQELVEAGQSPSQACPGASGSPPHHCSALAPHGLARSRLHALSRVDVAVRLPGHPPPPSCGF